MLNTIKTLFPKVLLVLTGVNPLTAETNFFLMNIPLDTGQQSSVVFFTNPSSKVPVPLCLTDDDYNTSNLDLLAQKVCTFSKFPTFLKTDLVKPSAAMNLSQESYSKVFCYHGFDKSISCSRSSSSPRPCSLLHVTCGACHSNVILQPNSSLQVMSPLYPVLQPGLMCQYDFFLAKCITADISIELADLRLDPAQSSPSGQQNYTNSFVQILSGDSVSDLKSVGIICGDVFDSRESSIFKLKHTIVRILLVAGYSHYYCIVV